MGSRPITPSDIRVAGEPDQMKLAVIGGTAGSGGYQRYMNGIFGRGNVPPSMKITIFCTPDLADKLNAIDERIELCVREEFRQSASAFCFRRLPASCIAEVRAFNPDVVLFGNGFIQKGLGAYPAVVTFHNMLMMDIRTVLRNRLSRSTILWLLLAMKQRATFRKAAGVIFLSPYSREVASKKVPGIRKSVVIAHGLDDDFRVANPPAKTIRKAAKILYLSTLFTYKHQIEVVRAVHQLRQRTGTPAVLSLVGGGDSKYSAKLNGEISRLNAGEYTEVLGDIPHEKLPEIIDDADIFLYASSCETFGITLLEGMGRGAVIACSNLTGLPDLLRDGGEYFDPREPASISVALERLIASPSLCEQYASRAHAYSKGYIWSQSAGGTFKFLQELNGEIQ